MITSKMQEFLTHQVNVELGSAYFYLAAASYFKSQHFEGFSQWMTMQAQEELQHAMKYYNYLLDRGVAVQFKDIPAPKSEWSTPIAAFEAALEHEKRSSKLINEQMDLALQEKDHATHFFLEWFVNEQVEEEASIEGILEKLRMVGNDPTGLLIMDSKLAQRQTAGHE